jgi:hypothetical protein
MGGIGGGGGGGGGGDNADDEQINLHTLSSFPSPFLQTVPPAAKEAYPFFYTQKFEKKNAGPMENGSDPVVVCQVGR